MSHLKVDCPRNGDVLSRHDGVESDEGLAVEIAGRCAEGADVTVNGAPAEVKGGRFSAKLSLRDTFNRLNISDGEADEALILIYDRKSFRRYRLGVDDNIWFLHEIASKPSQHTSFFDHWYTAFFRSLNRDFGTKVHFNVYFEHPDEGFDLTRFPDKYRGEIEDNRSWLSFSFHARADRCYNNRIYRDADYDTARRDHQLLSEQAGRIFGRAFRPEFTTIHWAETSYGAARGFRDEGIRGVVGRYGFDPKGKIYSTRMYLDDKTIGHLHNRNMWYDSDLDMLHVNTPQFLNNIPMESVRPHYDSLINGADGRAPWDVIEMLVHEEHFWRGYSGHKPDNMERCRLAMQWASENGFKSVFFQDGLAGNPESQIPEPCVE